MQITDADREAARSLGYYQASDTHMIVRAFARHRESAFEAGVLSTYSQRARDLEDARIAAARQALEKVLAVCATNSDSDNVEGADGPVYIAGWVECAEHIAQAIRTLITE